MDWENRSASIADAKKAIPKLKKAAGINIRIYSPKPVEQAERRSMYLPSDELQMIFHLIYLRYFRISHHRAIHPDQRITAIIVVRKVAQIHQLFFHISRIIQHTVNGFQCKMHVLP